MMGIYAVSHRTSTIEGGIYVCKALLLDLHDRKAILDE